MQIKDAFDAEKAVNENRTLKWTTAGGSMEHSLRCGYIVKTALNNETGQVTLVPSAWQPIDIPSSSDGYAGALAIHRYMQNL